ncbi:transcriptional regulator [Bacillus sp. Soil745]|jgi:AcrR family transcriptional regulator|uniref:TetR/AcrR family transcriptional regulator n=1 Tax=Peribacillus frigoritolerans TaxID=450367 RepID=UPI000710F132|nr:TetR/AcrR family transcriptional regulator [Peribacillus frigoritolerans]KRF51991.1 transcriptional regulator [Bacillus sp. Soil745]PAW30592.1 TetR family transcriptional regulator [Peribacillus simplex]MED3710112.1 TetR/AcrR family transcriptional regulator [Peribacillus frigoritolerans]ULM99349.1 TetR/AcrR family transcriptional regulator [Peribacillus frigoritolerans]WHX69250.1 TetR/AcrR family transcriptional regulator [Peribacillus frigoritolerans]
MPRTPEENDRIRQASKEKIRAAAMELFIKQGYYATSISDIAKQAGISKGLLYNYYKGKEELLSEMVEARIKEVVEVMEEAFTLNTPREQLEHIINGAIDNIHQKPEVHRFYLHLQTQPESDEELIKYSHLIIEENARQFEFQCKIFESMGETEPRKRSLYFSSVLQGIMLMISTYQQGFPIEEIKNQIISEFCN